MATRYVRFCVAVFLALGSMISFAPREGETRYRDAPETPRQGIDRHFAAAWGYLGKAVRTYGD